MIFDFMYTVFIFHLQITLSCLYLKVAKLINCHCINSGYRNEVHVLFCFVCGQSVLKAPSSGDMKPCMTVKYLVKKNLVRSWEILEKWRLLTLKSTRSVTQFTKNYIKGKSV